VLTCPIIIIIANNPVGWMKFVLIQGIKTNHTIISSLKPVIFHS
jgi:hypothetical protein